MIEPVKQQPDSAGQITRPASRGYVLKKDDGFVILDHFGNIRADLFPDRGFYLNDCRQLSRLELRLGTVPALALATNLSHDGTVLVVDLANAEIHGIGDQEPVSREQVHVLRQMFLWSNTLHQRLEIQTFAARPLWLMLQIIYDADFRDMFEIRGSPRAQRGRIEPVHVDRNHVRLSYRGRDELHRSTTLHFDPLPAKLTPTAAFFQLQLNPGERVTLRTSIKARHAEAGTHRAPGRVSLMRDYRALRRHQRAQRTAAPRLKTSNELFNQWLHRSISDLNMLLSETSHGVYPFAGIPWFNTAFGRDGLITALLSLEFQPSIARGVLQFLAATQAEDIDPWSESAPGKILHETRQGEMARLNEVPFASYYGSVDATPLFVMLAGAYYRRTGDRALLDTIWPQINRALNWMDSDGDSDADGFIEYDSSHATGLRNQGWKDSGDAIAHADGAIAEGRIALCEVQAYAFAAKRSAASLATEFGNKKTADRLSSQAAELATKFDKAFWDEEFEIYVLALDGDKVPCRVRASNAGHALFGGIAEPSRAPALVRSLSQRAMFSGWGIRTLSSSERWYNPLSYHNGSVWPHDNALIATGMARYGYRAEPLRILTGLFDASLFLGLHRMPELFCGFSRRPGRSPVDYAESCSPQAWASATVYGLISAVLGLSAHGRARQVRIEHPVLPPYLDYLSIENLQVGEAYMDLLFERTHTGATRVVPTRFDGDIKLVISP